MEPTPKKEVEEKRQELMVFVQKLSPDGVERIYNGLQPLLVLFLQGKKMVRVPS